MFEWKWSYVLIPILFSLAYRLGRRYGVYEGLMDGEPAVYVRSESYDHLVGFFLAVLIYPLIYTESAADINKLCRSFCERIGDGERLVDILIYYALFLVFACIWAISGVLVEKGKDKAITETEILHAGYLYIEKRNISELVDDLICSRF